MDQFAAPTMDCDEMAVIAEESSHQVVSGFVQSSSSGCWFHICENNAFAYYLYE